MGAPPSVEAQLSSLDVTAEQRAGVSELADRLYGHVLRLVDLDRLYQLEQCLWSELGRQRIHDEMGDLATSLLAEALHRVGHAPERHAKTTPVGISPDEVIAAEYDDACLMCRNDVADMEYRHSGRCCEDLARNAEDKEWLQLVKDAAKRWRADNATSLRRFGLM
jgi:hypothetical protein